MGIFESELIICTTFWFAGAAMTLAAVWLVISYKKRALRRRQRQYRAAYEQTYGRSSPQRKSLPPIRLRKG